MTLVPAAEPIPETTAPADPTPAPLEPVTEPAKTEVAGEYPALIDTSSSNHIRNSCC